MTIRAPSVKKHRHRYRWAFAAIGLISLVVLALQTRDQAKKAAAYSDQLSKIQESADNATSQLKAMTHAVATNASIPNEVKIKVLENQNEVLSADSDVTNLDSLKTQLDNKRQMGAINDDQNKRDLERLWWANQRKTFPTFEYAIRELEKMLTVLSDSKHDKTTSDFAGMPDHLDSGRTRLCEIKMVRNLDWDFLVSVVSSAQLGPIERPRLYINCKDIELEVTYTDMGNPYVGSTLSQTGQHPVYEGEKASLYRVTIEKALKDLIAAKAEESP